MIVITSRHSLGLQEQTLWYWLQARSAVSFVISMPTRQDERSSFDQAFSRSRTQKEASNTTIGV